MRSEYEPSDVDEQVDEKEQRARLLEALAPSERLDLKVLRSQLDALNLRLLALREAGLPVVHAVEGAQRRREVATAFLGYFTREALESNSVDSRLAEADLEGKSSVTANSFTFAAELSMLLLLKLEAPHLAAPLAKLRIAVTLLVEALTSSCDSSVVASCVADTSARELMPALAKLATQKQIASEAHATNALRWPSSAPARCYRVWTHCACLASCNQRRWVRYTHPLPKSSSQVGASAPAGTCLGRC